MNSPGSKLPIYQWAVFDNVLRGRRGEKKRKNKTFMYNVFVNVTKEWISLRSNLNLRVVINQNSWELVNPSPSIYYKHELWGRCVEWWGWGGENSLLIIKDKILWWLMKMNFHICCPPIATRRNAYYNPCRSSCLNRHSALPMITFTLWHALIKAGMKPTLLWFRFVSHKRSNDFDW